MSRPAPGRQPHAPAPRSSACSSVQAKASESVTQPEVGEPDLLDRLPAAQAAELLLSVGRLQGNNQVQRLVNMQRSPGEDDDSTALMGASVDAIHGALAKSDADLLLAYLSNRSKSSIDSIRSQYESNYGPLDEHIARDLYAAGKGYLYDSDYMIESAVKALALIEDGHLNNIHTQIALAIIPKRTRDTDLFRLLKAVSKKDDWNGIYELKQNYKKCFTRIGAGSLKGDLESDLSGNDELRALAMIDHPYSEADELYLTDESAAVINMLQAAWLKGPAAMAQLEGDWKQNVIERNKWTSLSLRNYLYGEAEGALLGGLSSETPLSESHRIMAKAMFEGSDQQSEITKAFAPKESIAHEQGSTFDTMAGLAAAVGVSPDLFEQDWQLQSRLKVAKALFTAAVGEEEMPRIRETSKLIGDLHHERSALAEKFGAKGHADQVKKEWDSDREMLLASLAEQLGGKSAGEVALESIPIPVVGTVATVSELLENEKQVMTARLLLAGGLTPADELWLAELEGDATKTVACLTKAWANKKIDGLMNAARSDRKDPKDPSVVLRPAFRPGEVAEQSWGWLDEERVAALTKLGSDAERGMLRLKLEIEEGSSDADLKNAYDFLTTEGVDADLRNYIIYLYGETFATATVHRLNLTASHGIGRFLAYISDRYQNSRTCLDFLDLLAPAWSMAEIVRRAEMRHEADVGWVDWTAGKLDIFSGEDYEEVATESLKRLRYIEAHEGSPADLAALMSSLGVSTTLELGRVEYDLLKQRLADVKAFREKIAAALGELAEIAMKAGLIAVFGPAGVVWIAAVSKIGGILVRKGISTGNIAHAFDESMAFEVGKAMALAHTGARAGKLFAEGTELSQHFERFGKTGAFIKEAAKGSVGKVTGGAIDAVGNWELPTGYDVLAGLVDLTSGGLNEAMKFKAKDAIIDDIDRYLQVAKANILTSAGGELATATLGWIESGTGPDLSVEAGQQMGLSALSIVLKSAKGAGETVLEEMEFFDTEALGKDLASLEPHELMDYDAASSESGRVSEH